MSSFAECLEKKNSKEFSLLFLEASIFLLLYFLRTFTITEVQRFLKIFILKNRRKRILQAILQKHFQNVFPVIFCTPETHSFHRIFNFLLLKVLIFKIRFLITNNDLHTVNYFISNFEDRL